MQLQAPTALVLGEDLVIAYTYAHLDDPVRAHTACDRIGIYFIGEDGDEDRWDRPAMHGRTPTIINTGSSQAFH